MGIDHPRDGSTRPTLKIGTVVREKYHVDGVLGVGGMATVYAVTHRNRKRFALKVLHPELARRRDVRSRFAREGYVANTVEHPGVVAILDDDVAEDDSPFLVLELLTGCTVEALLAGEGLLPVRESLLILVQLLDVLGAAHAKGVIHRDIKPANLFVVNDGSLKVLDFGIARLRDPTASLLSTRAGAALGTPAFMAPEQALALPGETDARTDVWAAGATLFTMLSGRLVHEAENARQVMVRAATTPAPSLANVAPALPSRITQIVDRALAFEKSDRWQSAAEMLAAIERAQADLCGAANREHLAVLATASMGWASTSPTEPSPDSSSGAADDENVAPVGLGVKRPRAFTASLPPPSILTTTSKPVAGDRSQAGNRTKPAIVVGALVVVLGFGLALNLSRSAARTASSPNPAPLVVQSPRQPIQKPPPPRIMAASTALPAPSALPAATREPPRQVSEARPSSSVTPPLPLPRPAAANEAAALPSKPIHARDDTGVHRRLGG